MHTVVNKASREKIDKLLQMANYAMIGFPNALKLFSGSRVIRILIRMSTQSKLNCFRK